MNPGDIPQLLSGALKRVRSIIRETVRLPFFKIYLFLSFVLIIFFTILNFPYEALVLKQIYSLENKAYRSIVIGEFDFNLVGESSIYNMTLRLKNNHEISMGQLIADLDLSPFNFISKTRIAGDLSGRGIKYEAGKTTISCNASSNIDFNLIERRGTPAQGTFKIIIENAVIRMDNVTLPASMGSFPLPPVIKASSIIINSEIRGRKLLVNTFKISGPDIEASVTGNISLANFIKNSRLNLKVSVKSDSPLLKDFAPFLKNITDSRGRITFPVKGSIGRPKPEIKLGGPTPGL